MTENTKEHLISAAARLLDSGGQAGVTLRAVAEQVGVSHNAPYRHFRDRSALLGAVAERDFHYLREAFNAVAEGEDSRRALLQACAALVDYARRHKARYRLLFSDPGLPQDEGLSAAAFATFQTFSLVVSRCQDENVLPKSETVSLTGLIYAAVHGAIDLELGGRASGAKGLGSIDATLELLFDLLGRSADRQVTQTGWLDGCGGGSYDRQRSA